MYMDWHTRATAAPLVFVSCSEGKTYSPEAPSYKTTISFQKSTIQHTVLCCAAGFMTEAWSRVLLEKLTVPRLVKKFPAFYAAHRLATVCTIARHLSTPFHPHNLISFHTHTHTPRSPKWSHSIRFLHQKTVHICVSYVPHVPPIHPTRFDHPNIILFREEYKPWTSSLCNFLHCSVTSALLGPNTFLSTILSISLSLCCFLDVRDKFHTHTQEAKLQWWVPPSLDWFMALIINQQFWEFISGRLG
jgi:hypothetical protein